MNWMLIAMTAVSVIGARAAMAQPAEPAAGQIDGSAPAPVVATEEPRGTPQEIMSGPWRLSGLGGAPLCEFDLTSDARGREGTLAVKPGCMGEWRTREFARWTLRGKDLTLWDRRKRPIRSFRKVNAYTFEHREEMNEYMGRGEMLFFGKDLQD